MAENVKNLKVSITQEDSRKARKYAKSLGYTYQGWIGHLIRQAMQQNMISQFSDPESEGR